MDRDEFRLILRNSGVDVWDFIDTAISVAYSDYGDELRQRRDGIVERMYMSSRCGNCNLPYQHSGSHKDCDEERADEKAKSPPTPQSINRSESEDPYGGLFDEEESRILDIKEHLEDPDQPEGSIVDLLQTLADMDITFKALKETDIGRHVNRLRKHPSNDVRRLVKHLVRKWKDLVDEWVKSNPTGELTSSALMAEGDSPPQKIAKAVHHQVPDFGYSPNPQNGSSGSDKNSVELEPKAKAVLRREASARPTQPVPASNSVPSNNQRDTTIDPDKFASARKRLHENYQEAQNAKKQRTIQVMDIHEIPKPKNAFFPKSKVGSHGRHR